MTVLSYERLDGTTSLKFTLAAATGTGVVLKNDSGSLDVRNTADTAFKNINVAEAFLQGTTYYVGLQPSSSASASYTLTMPVSAGSTGQILSTDGTGVLSWVSAGSTAACLTYKTTTLTFGSSSTVSIMTLPANAIIDTVQVDVDTAFDGTPTMSVGITANNSKYFGTGDANLNVAAQWETSPGLPADASSEAINIYYTPGSSTVGSARVLISYAVPA